MQNNNYQINKIYKQGFTLVEMLIVITIIGILAAIALVQLGGARTSARDAKRISDMASIQSALELYYTKTGFYPNAGGWASMSAILTSANLGMRSIPNDSVSGKTYYYSIANPSGQHYVIGAVLESDNSILKSADTIQSGNFPSSPIPNDTWSGDANSTICNPGALGYCIFH